MTAHRERRALELFLKFADFVKFMSRPLGRLLLLGRPNGMAIVLCRKITFMHYLSERFLLSLV